MGEIALTMHGHLANIGLTQKKWTCEINWWIICFQSSL